MEHEHVTSELDDLLQDIHRLIDEDSTPEDPSLPALDEFDLSGLLDDEDAIPDMEESDGGIFLLEQLHSAIGEGEYINRNIDIENVGNIIFYDTNIYES